MREEPSKEEHRARHNMAQQVSCMLLQYNITRTAEQTTCQQSILQHSANFHIQKGRLAELSSVQL